MAWEKADPELSELLEAAIGRVGGDKRVMFGGPAYFAGGNMFAGVHQTSILLKLSEDDRQAIREASDEIEPFAPMGRPMREYVVLPPAIYEDDAGLDAWLSRGRAYAASQPPKERKPRKGKKA